jgi:uncharacterized protein
MKKTQRASVGRSEALYKRSVAYYNGDGVRRNLRRAFAVMQEAASLGSAKAQSALGSHYEFGIGVTRSASRAFEHYKLAALAGYADAQYNVAGCYYGGIGTRKNHRLAVQWLQKAAKRRVPEAVFLLGCCYEHGRGTRTDRVRAMKLYVAAARLGYPEAHVEVGLHNHDRNPKQAVERYRKGAQLGSAAGQFNLARCLERGDGVRPNLREAARWYRAAAKQGNGKARMALEALEKRTTASAASSR